MPARRISRRGLLKAGGVTLGAAALTCSGVAYVATPPASAPEVATPEFSFGKEGSMSKRILVTYATRTGSTVDVAATIGETLGGQGFIVDVRPVKENPAPECYQAVVIGSAVNGAQWLPEAVEFVKSNRQALNRVAVALFSVHIMNTGDDEKSRANRLAYLDAVRPLLKPLDEAFFAGVGFNPARQSWLEGWLYRAFKVGPEGDCRDWNRIRGWAESLAPSLQQA